MGSLYSVRKPPHPRTMGIELECILSSDQRINAAVGYDMFWQFWYMSSDGSIDADWPAQGYEFISQPLPMEALIKQIKRLHRKLGDWKYNTSCGIHVHVSRSLLQINRKHALLGALKLLTAEQEVQLFGRARNPYADPTVWPANKYCSINTNHSSTYEFRMFSSGDADWACECVRRTYLLVTYKGEYTYENICKLFGV